MPYSGGEPNFRRVEWIRLRNWFEKRKRVKILQENKTVFRLTFDFNVEDAASEWRIHRADDVPSEIEDVAVHRFNVKEFAVFTLQFEELSLYALGGYVAHDPVFLQEKAQRDATSTKNYQRTTITIGSETTKKESGSFWSVAVKAENWNRRLKSLH